MKKVSFLLILLLVVLISFQGCTVQSMKHVEGTQKLYNNSLSSYGWSDDQADQIISRIGVEKYYKVYKYIFLAKENIDLSADEIIVKDRYVGIPVITYDNNFQYVFFSEGPIPFEIDLPSSDFKRKSL